MGYYDYGPLVTLPRSVALIGFLGAGTAQLGHSLASNLGLPLIDIDRRIEHHAGMSLAQLQLQQGETVRRQWEQSVLRKAVREQPYGVIVLGDGALLQEGTISLMKTHTDLFYLKRPLEYLQRAIAQELSAHPARYPEFSLLAHSPDSEQLKRLFEPRAAGYAAAPRTIDGGDDHPSKLSRSLQRDLQETCATATDGK